MMVASSATGRIGGELTCEYVVRRQSVFRDWETVEQLLVGMMSERQGGRTESYMGARSRVFAKSR